MKESGHRFRQLIEQLRAGDEEAARRLTEEYGPHICRSIRRRFRNHRVRTLYGTEDCLQSVWGVVFSDPGVVAGFQSPDDLIRYLVKLASNKMAGQHRHHFAGKHDVRLDVELSSEIIENSPDLAAPEPSPSQQVALQDDIDHRARDLSPTGLRVLSLVRAGHSSREIAKQVTRSTRSVRTMLSRLRRLFEIE